MLVVYFEREGYESAWDAVYSILTHVSPLVIHNAEILIFILGLSSPDHLAFLSAIMPSARGIVFSLWPLFQTVTRFKYHTSPIWTNFYWFNVGLLEKKTKNFKTIKPAARKSRPSFCRQRVEAAIPLSLAHWMTHYLLDWCSATSNTQYITKKHLKVVALHALTVTPGSFGALTTEWLMWVSDLLCIYLINHAV